MSAYGSFETVLCEEKHLVAALKALGFDPEVHPGEGAHLYGYTGDTRPEKANVIIRRAQVGIGSNDIGFVRNPDGKYSAIISEFDKRTYDQAWLGKVSQFYGESRTISVAFKQGYKLLNREVMQDGKIRLQFTAGR